MIQKVKKDSTPYPVVTVSWVDSEHNSDWKPLSEVLEDKSDSSMECLSAGFLVSDKSDRIILATSVSSSQDYEEQISAFIVIPKAAILWQKELSPKRAKKVKKIES